MTSCISRISLVAVLIVFIGVLPAFAQNNPPQVTNVTPAQRTDGSKRVDICYDLADADGDACTVTVEASNDGGSTWTVPITAVTGISGEVTPGTHKHILWDCSLDLPGVTGSQYKVRVCADDGQGTPPPGMVLIPAGEFQMGNCMSSGEGGAEEGPVHEIHVDAFYMDTYEVSKGLWDAVRTWATANGYDLGDIGSGKATDHPVVYVNWYDCVKWCNARSQQEGRSPRYYTNAGLTTVYKTGQVTPYVNWDASGYRLPTEAEWEKAARGGTPGHRFPWSDQDTIQHARCNYYSSSSYSYDTSPTRGYHPDFDEGGYPYTSPVGYFGPNGYGVYDAAGNVFEWCNDWYGETYYGSSPPSNPHGPASGSYRVLRGGAWGSFAYVSRAADRDWHSPGGRENSIGFRCAMETPGGSRGSDCDDSANFLIENRDGSGLRLIALTATHAGVFVSDADFINTITATIDWAGKAPQKVVFDLGGDAHETSTAGTTAETTFNMGTDLSYSRAGALNVLSVYAVAADGSISAPWHLHFWGLALPEWAISLETGQDLGWRIEVPSGRLVFFGETQISLDPTNPEGKLQTAIGIPGSIPEVGGEWGLSLDPLTFEWELAAQPRFGDGMGITGTFDLSGSWGAEGQFGSKREGALSATLSGAGEFYPEFKLTEVNANLAGSFTFLFPRAPLLCAWTGCCHTGYCPYFQASIKPELAGIVGMEEGEPELIAGLKFKNATLELAATVAGTVGAGSEGSLYEISGTIGGQPSITLQFPGDPESACLVEYIQEVAFDLIARYTTRAAWWEIGDEWVFNIFTCPDGEKHLIGTPTGERRITLINRDYLNAPEGYCVFPSDRGFREVGPLPAPILNVGTGPRPSLDATSDAGLLLFVYDDAGQPTGQHQEIYFARWEGGEWTTNAPLTVNSRPDIQPAAAIDDAGTEIAVWVTAPQPTGSESGPRDVLPAFEITWSTYDPIGEVWATPQAMTTNAYVDMLPWIETLPDGSLRVCWISSPTNAIPVWHDEEIAPELDVMAADWNGTTFGAPYSVATGLQAVSPPSITRTATHEYLTYLYDADDNSGTAEDREVMVRSREIGQAWDADQQLTTDALSDTAARVAIDETGSPMVVWVKRMVPYMPPEGEETHVDQLWFSSYTDSAWAAPALAFETDGITEPKLVRNNAGRLVLFWVAASDEFSDIYYAVYDATLGQWGQPQQITHDEGAETMLATAISSGNILSAYVKRRIDLESDPDGVPVIGLSDIYLMQHVPTKDLSVAAADLRIDPTSPVPGESATLCADALLTGDFTVENVVVEFYDGDPAESGVLIDTASITSMLPGETTSACVSWLVPDDGEVHSLFVVVDPADTIAELSESNNKASISPFAPDLRVSAPTMIGSPGPDTVLVGCTIRNDGTAIAGTSTLQVRKDSETGDVIFSSEMPGIDPDDGASIQFAWDVSGVSADTHTLFFITDSGDAVNESNEGNNIASIPVRVMGDLQAEQWSAGISAGTASVTIRNVGSKPMAATIVRVYSGEQTMGESVVPALDAGGSTDVEITLSVVPAGWLEIVVSPDSDGSDEVTLLNNTVLVSAYSTGDMNCDGAVDMADVSLFVEAIMDPAAFDAAHPDCGSGQADVDGSGISDGKDVQAFVALMLAP